MAPPQQLNDAKKALEMGTLVVGTIIAIWGFLEYFSKPKAASITTSKPCGTCTQRTIRRTQ
jgi:hypothetical protein